jgi:hypothetical protein
MNASKRKQTIAGKKGGADMLEQEMKELKK